jgi:hypothetical protein
MNGVPFDDIDPRFQPIWKKYEEFSPMGPFGVFVPRAKDPQLR